MRTTWFSKQRCKNTDQLWIWVEPGLSPRLVQSPNHQYYRLGYKTTGSRPNQPHAQLVRSFHGHCTLTRQPLPSHCILAFFTGKQHKTQAVQARPRAWRVHQEALGRGGGQRHARRVDGPQQPQALARPASGWWAPRARSGGGG
jgi:hypothetical protein